MASGHKRQQQLAVLGLYLASSYYLRSSIYTRREDILFFF